MTFRFIAITATLLLAVMQASAQLSKELVESLNKHGYIVEEVPESPKENTAKFDIAEFERKAAKFDSLILSEYWEDVPRLHAEAVGVFGEEFVQGWQEADEETRAQLAWMRFNEMVMREEGEDDIDALMRYRDQTGDKTVESDAAMWKHYATGRKAELDRRERALAAFDTLVMAGDGDLKPDDRERVVELFGEEFVTDWESCKGDTRAGVTGIRFNEEVMMRKGDSGPIDGIVRYCDLTGENVGSARQAWKHYATGRKAELEEAGIFQSYLKEQEMAQQRKREAEKERLQEQQHRELLQNILYGICVLLILYPAYKLIRMLITYRQGELLPSAACILLLLLALAPLPYGYYIFLRLCICAWCISEIVKHPLIIARILLIGTALLYNPIIRVPLTRPIWSVLNIITIILIIGITIAEQKHKSTE